MEGSQRAGFPGPGASQSSSNSKRPKTNADDPSSVLSVLGVVWLHVYPFLDLEDIYRVGFHLQDSEQPHAQ